MKALQRREHNTSRQLYFREKILVVNTIPLVNYILEKNF